jgi:hypothetical protein
MTTERRIHLILPCSKRCFSWTDTFPYLCPVRKYVPGGHLTVRLYSDPNTVYVTDPPRARHEARDVMTSFPVKNYLAQSRRNFLIATGAGCRGYGLER